jgi:hypothetical protein
MFTTTRPALMYPDEIEELFTPADIKDLKARFRRVMDEFIEARKEQKRRKEAEKKHNWGWVVDDDDLFGG